MKYNEIVGFKFSSRVKSYILNFVKYPMHLHDTVLELMCVLDGNIKAYDGSVCYDMCAGDVFISGPLRPHKYVAEQKNSVLFVQLDLRYYKNLFKEFDLIDEMEVICNSFNTENRNSQDIKYLRFLMAKAFKECNSEMPSEVRLEELAEELLVFLLENFRYFTFKKTEDGKYYRIQKGNHEHTQSDINRIREIIHTINQRYHEKISLDDLAGKYYLSPAYLSRFIKKMAGLSFSELISLRRCEEAGKLLSSTNNTIDQISSEVGFSGRNNLSKQFQKWFGCTPTEYRQLIRDELKEDIDLYKTSVDYNRAEKIIERFLDAY